jgi:hypothetical protein
MATLLSHFISPSGLERLHVIVAASAVLLAFGFAAIVVLAV